VSDSYRCLLLTLYLLTLTHILLSFIDKTKEIIIKTASKLQVLGILLQHLDVLKGMDVAIARHAEIAVAGVSFCVDYLQIVVFLFAVLEQTRGYGWVKNSWLEDPRENQIGSHRLGDPSQDLILLSSGVVLAVPLSIRILAAFVLVLSLFLW
jgi:hypothetical protein